LISEYLKKLISQQENAMRLDSSQIIALALVSESTIIPKPVFPHDKQQQLRR
jgi:hypothetical protein